MAGSGRQSADTRLLIALAAGRPVAEAAAQARISERTVWRRLGEPDFRHRLFEARGQMLDRAVERLSEAATSAADTLTELLDADSETVRLGAARAILELGGRLRDAGEIEERLLALERWLEEQDGKRKITAA